jgi:integrase
MPPLKPLTDAAARALRPKADRYDVPDGRVPGLVLSVLPSGLKQWTLRYRTQGKRRRLILGEFGDYPKLTLSKARETAEKHRPKIREGADPVADRAAAKAIPVDTVAALAKDYVSKQVQVHHRRPDEEERILNVYVLPAWKDRSVRGLTRRDVRTLVEPIADRAPVMANRVLAVVRRMLNFGVRRDWIEANPASLIDKPGRENTRDRVLSDEELRALWALLQRFPATHEKQAPGRKRARHDADGKPFCPISPALAAVQKVRLLTAQRGGEVVAMRWQDLDLRTPAAWWTIPGEIAKNGQPHRVPLTADVVKIIKAQFPDGEPKPDSHVFAHIGESVKDRAKKAGASLSRVLEFEFRGHDLRRTAATRMAEAGVPRLHISAVLNHVEGGPTATRVYDRYSYDAEKRAALETWAKDLSRILNAKPNTGAAIVPLKKRA